MTILLVNDDGYFAEGIKILRNALEPLGRIVLLAPNREYSATGHKIHCDKLFRVEEKEKDIFVVNGTPADCVRLALNGALDIGKIDLIVSGMNHGANLGMDIYCSGTLAAAREGLFYGVPSIAFSLCCFDKTEKRRFFNEASLKAKAIIEEGLDHHLFNSDIYYNVNIPNKKEFKGIKTTSLGGMFYDLQVEEVSLKNQKYCFLDSLFKSDSDQEDFLAVKEGYISITPLKLDVTDYEMLKKIEKVF